MPEGRWLDIPFAQSLAALLAAEPPSPPGPGPSLALDSRPIAPLWRPPVTLFFVELHEEEPLKKALQETRVHTRMERFVPQLGLGAVYAFIELHMYIVSV